MTVSTSIFDSSYTTSTLIRAYLGGDDKENEEPIHDEDTNIDADNWNKLVAGLEEVAKRLRPGNLAVYEFSQANCTASQTNVDLQRAGDDAARTGVTAWRDGSVVGLAVWVEGARSAGTLTVSWTIGGTEQTMTCIIDDSPTQFGRSYQLPGVETFDALDVLGVSVTTDATWAAGATPSISCDLIVSYGEEEDI
jgi:hypothetical protein